MSWDFIASAWRRDGVRGVGLFLLTFIVYAPVWNAAPIWDDDKHMTQPALQTAHGLARIWTEPGATQQYYPLMHSAFWVQHRLWGDDPMGYHLVNILLHVTSALLLVKILRRLEIPGAWLAAALFALHPVEVESVAWISELKNTLSGIFYLTAALAYLRFDEGRKAGNYCLALVLFAFGLMSKTVVATFPAAILVVLWWRRGRLSWVRDALPTAPFFILGAGAGLFTAWVERKFIGAEGSEFNFTLVERCLIAGRAFWFYLGKLVWPVHLAFIYPRWHVSQAVWWQYLFPVAALLLTAVMVWRRWRGPLAALLFFAGSLFPALGFVNVYPFRFSFVADHFQYLASLGPIVLAVSSIRKPVVGGIILVALAALTIQQCAIYANVETLWRATLRLNPDCWMAHYNLGLYDLRRGWVDAAISHYQEAVDLKPDFGDAQNNLGLSLMQAGRIDEAIGHFRLASKLKPVRTEVFIDLGGALLEQGRAAEAVPEFQRALNIDARFAGAHYDLGLSCFLLGRWAEAVAEYEKALALQPDYAEAQKNLAWILATCPEAALRNGTRAVALAERSSQVENGENPVTLNILAAAYAEAGRFGDAVPAAQRALSLAEARSNIALAAQVRAALKLYQAGQPLRHPGNSGHGRKAN